MTVESYNNGDSSSSSLQSLIYVDNVGSPSLSVLDQLKIPDEKIYIDVPDSESAWKVIRNMQIRGAPLIGVVACLALGIELNHHDDETRAEMACLLSREALVEYVEDKMRYLCTSRPTAVNLRNGMDELRRNVLRNLTLERHEICPALLEYAERMLQRDVMDNRRIGEHGAQAILHPSHALRDSSPSKKVTIVTICNTGSLATAGYGTALGVIRAIHERNQLEKVVILETRPYNQGSRLTAFEAVEDNLPSVLICDSMAAAYMSQNRVDACVVGADRVCANGDTANKIGTLNLALIAAAHHVPFYPASPFTTLDLTLKEGKEIEIEERPAVELLSTSRAPSGIECWNPAFDVTPARYITGIITERGVITPSADGKLDVAAFAEKHKDESSMENVINSDENADSPAAKMTVPFDYTEQSNETLPAYLAKNAPGAMEVLKTHHAEDLSCVEMGDGNLNLVFIVTNDKHDDKPQVIVKQALPYVRCVGPEWPLSLTRSFFEYRALVAEHEACPEFVPEVFHFSKPQGLIAMQYLAPPHIILRKGLIQGIRYPSMATDMGTFCAKTLFKTSGFKLSPSELRKNLEFWTTNHDMCALTEQVVFTEPYIKDPNNRWTSPQLDDEKLQIENDLALKVAATKLKAKFVTETQALIHGDLHSGSVMCSDNSTYVIDPEFAFYGPMGFDTGAFVANLFLAYCSRGGHDSNDVEYPEWILEQIQTFWNTFLQQFMVLWNDPAEHTGSAYKRRLLETPEHIEHAQEDFTKVLLHDTLGFAGMKMIRRIVGIAHVEDMESIENADVRAICEKHALTIGKTLVKGALKYNSMEEVLKLARETRPASYNA